MQSKAVVLNITASLAATTPPAWYILFNFDGVTFSIHNGPVLAAPGVNVSSIGAS